MDDPGERFACHEVNPGHVENHQVNLGIGTALVACLLSCYFAACHIALKTFSKARLSELLETRKQDERYDPFIQKVGSLVLMTAMLRSIANFIILLACLYAIEQVFNDQLAQYGLALLIAATITAIFGVAIPVSWARYHPEVLIYHSMRFLNVLLVICYPIIHGLHIFDPIVRRLSGADNEEKSESAVTDEVLSVVEEHENEGTVDTAQKQMIEAIFDLPNTTAGEIMTPRTEVSGIPVTATLEDIKNNILTHCHSRIPIYEDTIDHIVGMLYSKDLISHLGNDQPFDLKAIMRQVFMVPESKPVAELLAEFRARKLHIAVILDEYGGTAGLVTIEDILEELVGEIQDEHEVTEEAPATTRIDENTYEVEARIYIDDLNDQLDLELPEDEDYDTLGGFVFSTLGHIPNVDETFEFGNLRFTVTDALRTRVNRVRIERLTSEESTAAAG